jgi:flagellar biosynthesis/type III secretory pathway chaperone
LLQQEQAYASRLLDVLKAEHEALARRDTDALQQSVADKQELLAQLEASHGRRLQLMHDTGLDAGRDGFDALLSLCAEHGHDLHSSWNALKEVLASCQRQNQVNGAILESSRRTTHRALSVLLGGQADSPELYNQSGKSTPSALGGNRVIKA